MTDSLVVLLAVGVGVWLLVPSPHVAGLTRLRAMPPGRTDRDDGGRRASRRPLVMVLLPVPVVGLIVDGARGATLAAVTAMTAGTVAVLVVRWWRRRAGHRRAADVARAARVLAGQVGIGQAPSVALRVAAEDCLLLVRSEAVDRLGGSVTDHWRRAAREPGAHGLRRMAAAWELSGTTGAPLAPALDRVAATLAEDHRLAAVLDSELAAPRATARLLAALPVVGLGLGVVLGGDPIRFLTDEPAGQGCLLLGTALACAGTVWVERIAGDPTTRDGERR